MRVITGLLLLLSLSYKSNAVRPDNSTRRPPGRSSYVNGIQGPKIHQVKIPDIEDLLKIKIDETLPLKMDKDYPEEDAEGKSGKMPLGPLEIPEWIKHQSGIGLPEPFPMFPKYYPEEDAEGKSGMMLLECADILDPKSCASLQSKGDCKMHSFFCKKTCGLCPLPECYDNIHPEGCASLQRNGRCNVHGFASMCKKTCGLCPLPDMSEEDAEGKGAYYGHMMHNMPMWPGMSKMPMYSNNGHGMSYTPYYRHMPMNYYKGMPHMSNRPMYSRMNSPHNPMMGNMMERMPRYPNMGYKK